MLWPFKPRLGVSVDEEKGKVSEEWADTVEVKFMEELC